MSKIEPTTGNREIKANAESMRKSFKKFTLKELGKELNTFSPSNSSSAQQTMGC
jgi:hypothetical protein